MRQSEERHIKALQKHITAVKYPIFFETSLEIWMKSQLFYQPELLYVAPQHG